MKLYVLALAVALPAIGAAPDLLKGNTFGSPKAPLLIEVFSDFECPACKYLHDKELPDIMKDFVDKGKAYLIYRYDPLQMHQHGRQAAELVCAAAQEGKYLQAANALFATQETWSKDGRVAEALASALTPDERAKLPALAKSPAVQTAITHDMEEAVKMEVPGTPTLVITYQARRYPLTGPGVMQYTWVKSFLDSLLAK
jgi:protein-disulfide isomerase